MRWITALALVFTGAGWAFPAPIHAQMQYQFQILHGFGSSGDGNGPEGPVVFDQKGNLYGATYSGGTDTDGTAFELTPGGNGQWTETILHNFVDSLTDGADPTGVVMDAVGNLYGTTTHGGTNEQCAGGCGTVFELMPGANGQWTESILWSFCSLSNCADGGVPTFPPTLGPGGVLYGTAGQTAFQLSPGTPWTLTILYTLCSQPNCADGENPFGSLVLDAKGNLYGETIEGGTSDGGVVFGLHPRASGQWEEVVLHDFDVQDPSQGYDDSGGVTLHDRALFAATQAGGDSGCNGAGCGTVLELTRAPGNSIDEQVLHDFGPNAAQGINPIAAVSFDARGDLFGVTVEGGSPTCECGTVYGMKPQGNGKWAFAVLHSFVDSDGATPTSALAIDSEGNIYGTTQSGGPNKGGVVFELSPTTQASK